MNILKTIFTLFIIVPASLVVVCIVISIGILLFAEIKEYPALWLLVIFAVGVIGRVVISLIEDKGDDGGYL